MIAKKVSSKGAMAKGLLFIGVVLVVVAPFLLTRNFGLIDFTNSGQIGDTIGGITAPIVNLLGAVLVYFALQAQIEANAIIQSQIEEQRKEELVKKDLQYLTELYNHFKDSINSFEMQRETYNGRDRPREKTQLYGVEAVKYFVETLHYNRYCDELKERFYNIPKYIEFISIVKICEELITKVQNAKVYRQDKAFILLLLEHLYEFKIWIVFDNHNISEKLAEPRHCDRCKQEHPSYPLELFENIKSIKERLEQVKVESA